VYVVKEAVSSYLFVEVHE